MPKVLEYHRPASVEEAVGLLAMPDAAVLAGGTRINATPFDGQVVAIDIQSLGLSGIEAIGASRLRLGATTTLQQIADHPAVPAVLRELARREEPSTLRTLATVGGTVASGGWESELLTGLLAAHAEVTLRTAAGTQTVGLAALLADCELLRRALITDVSLHIDGTFAADHTGRTPGDRAIVLAVAHRSAAGAVTVALSGVAATPVVVDSLDGLAPPSDFRGTSEYRNHLARVLGARVRTAVAA